MTRIGDWLLAGVAMVVLAACGEESAPVTPKEIRVTSGNNQTGPAAGELPAPLIVTVIGSDDRPLAEAPVEWRVTIGSVSLTPRGPRSDANGVAEAVVTLDPVVAPVEILATVSGLTPVAFHATVVEPCVYTTPHTFGGVSYGRLRSGDCLWPGGSSLDWYSLTVPSEQAVWISMASNSLNAWVGVFRPNFRDGFAGRVAFDNDANTTTTDATVKALLPAGGFMIAASSLDSAETGSYTLTSGVRSSDAADCERMWVMPGVATTSQQLRAADCADSTGQWHADVFLVWLNPGEGVSLAQQSTAFRPYLILFDRQGALVAEGRPGPDGIARLSHTGTTRGTYFVFAGSEEPNVEGAYRLTVETLSSPAVARDREGTQAQTAVAPSRWIANGRRWRLPTTGLNR